MQHKCNKGATQTTNVRHERKIFDFDSDRSKNIFLHSHIYYMACERLQGEEQFHSKNYLLEMPCFHAKMRLKCAPQTGADLECKKRW